MLMILCSYKFLFWRISDNIVLLKKTKMAATFDFGLDPNCIILHKESRPTLRIFGKIYPAVKKKNV